MTKPDTPKNRKSRLVVLDGRKGGGKGDWGRVWLVGAGPGDPDLLTVKALKALQGADVVVHDGLVSDAILDLAPAAARRVSVAKRKSRHSYAQDEINRMLTAFAQEKFDYFQGPTLSERESLKKLGTNYREENWVLGNWNHFRFNTTRKPFTDARVRKALFLALDYAAINDGYYGKGQWEYTGPLVAAFPEAIPSAEIAKMPGYNPATKQADIKTAKDLMNAAGYVDGDVSFKITPYSIGSFEENVIRLVTKKEDRPVTIPLSSGRSSPAIELPRKKGTPRVRK